MERKRKRKEDGKKDYKFIQKFNRGLSRVPARTCIFACLNHLPIDVITRKRGKERERQGKIR